MPSKFAYGTSLLVPGIYYVVADRILLLRFRVSYHDSMATSCEALCVRIIRTNIRKSHEPKGFATRRKAVLRVPVSSSFYKAEKLSSRWWSHKEPLTKRLMAIHFEPFTELDLKIASGVAVSAATEILEAILLQLVGRKINSSSQNL
ncbi:hypothetical protein AnigIFM49718_003476 [Aspergillus niger]|nr:hypothetical protein AnigIFM49718_003476 [Aspergillus niger]